LNPHLTLKTASYQLGDVRRPEARDLSLRSSCGEEVKGFTRQSLCPQPRLMCVTTSSLRYVMYTHVYDDDSTDRD
jgi:hypothetical protein